MALRWDGSSRSTAQLGAEHQQFLDANCAADPDLRARLQRLLDADSCADAEALRSSDALYAEALQMAAESSPPLDSIGPYRIVARLGSGGMGAVYLAERDFDGVLRRVAIKIIPFARFDDDMLRRFRGSARSSPAWNIPISPACSMPAARRRACLTSSWIT